MKLLDFVVCDDIRREIGDKVSLMGVFADTIKLQIPQGAPKPVSFPLGLHLRLLLEEQDTVPDAFKVVINLDKREVAKIEGNIVVSGDRPKILGFAFPLKMFQVSGNATMSLTATFTAGGRLLMEVSPPYDISIQIVEIDTSHTPGVLR